jgi:2',3'-cyclic-nucleotide 2'-phosphodiesterase (5'-nucleotidase family)
MLAPDLAAAAVVAGLEAESGIPLCERLGCAATRLGRDRARGSPLGEAVADAILAASPGADFAIQNSGGLRADLAVGDVRLRDVYGVMPFDNRVTVVEMDGAHVLELFRVGSSGGHGALQVAGATYAYDPARTTGTDHDGDGAIADWERDRLCGARVGGRPIDPAARYRVATTDFLVTGGDHLGGAFAGATTVSTGPWVRDALATWIRAQPACLAAAPSTRVVVGTCAP